MRVLIIGSGGREHAIAWKLSQSSKLDSLFCAPGNPGTARFSQNLIIDIKNFKEIGDVVLKNSINMVVVGPEEPLVKGLRDYFENDPILKKVLFIGPGSAGAQLEGSKDFAKGFMEKYGIPTAGYMSFNAGSLSEAESFLESLTPPYVLKADGLAAGKGVIIENDILKAKAELREMFSGKFGEAGKRVVIEEFLSGIELSVFVLTDGKGYLILPEAKDYKRVGDGDTGLNTGGMGAVSPVPFADEKFMKKVEKRIIKPTIDGLKSEGIDYKGFIFIGLMNCFGEPYVIEYNVRMGDPETEAVLPRIESDLLEHFIALGSNKLDKEKIVIGDKTALTLVMTSGGYPGTFEKGVEIELDECLENITLFHSGTSIVDDKLVTSGGRVMALTVLSKDIEEGRKELYKLTSHVKFKRKYFRNDIGLDLI